MSSSVFALNKYPTLYAFAKSDAKIKVVTGPAGSAKTSFMAMELLRRACLQQPDAEGVRYTRMLVGRNTYQVLKSSTIPTFQNMYGGLATFKIGSTPLKCFIRVQLDDGTKVHCDIEFISFDSPDSISKLLGYEPTIVFLDEVSEISEDVVLAAARRTGRYPSMKVAPVTWHGVIAATNGPRKSHWLYKWYLGEKDEEFKLAEKKSGRKMFELFFQPPALLRQPDGDWLPNPKAENIDNLADGYGYYYEKLGDSPQDIQAYVEGVFADLVTGKLVFPQFNRELHVVDESAIDPSKTMALFLSFDFGRTPFCAVATPMPNGSLVVIDEYMAEDASIETLVVEHVIPGIRKNFPRSFVEGAWADPAGDVKTQAVELSPYDVLRKNGIPVQNPDPSNRLPPRLEAVKNSLTKLVGGGKPSLLISSKCVVIIESLGSNYIYELKRGYNGVVNDVPTKSHENWVSEAADAIQYLCLGYNTISKKTERREKYRSLPKRQKRFL